MDELDELGKSLVNRTDRLASETARLRSSVEEFSRTVMWGLIILGLSMTAVALMIPSCARAAFFNPVPNTLTNGTTGLSAQVNADYNQIVTDGNAANTNLLAQIAALGPRGLPAGAVVSFNSNCPVGFVLADGAQGRPDARGLFIRGLDSQAGRDLNRVLASYQADQIQNHFHAVTGTIFVSPNISNITTLFNGSSIGIPPSLLVFNTSLMISPVGLSETRPTSIILSYCVNTITGINNTPFSPPPATLSNVVVPDANIVMQDYNQIISDGNTAFNALQTAITNAAGAGLAPPPAGAVVPFNLTACPTGWVIADGTGGTVDMRARFARITTGSPAVGTVQADQFIDHTHNLTGAFVTGTSGSNLGDVNGPGSIAVIQSLANYTIVDAAGANVGTETRPKNVALLYCQKS